MGLQPHVRTQNHGKYPPPPVVSEEVYVIIIGKISLICSILVYCAGQML